MSRNAITDEEGTQIKSLPKNPSLPLPADDHEGEPVHGDPVENPDNVNEYEKEEEGKRFLLLIVGSKLVFFVSSTLLCFA